MKRLLLPPLGDEHSEVLARVYADPDVVRYISGAGLDAEGTAAHVVRSQAVSREHGIGASALIDRASGALLGQAGLHPRPQWDEVELAYVLARHVRSAASPPRPHEPNSTSRSASSACTASPRSSTPTTHRAGRWSPGSAATCTGRTWPRRVPVLVYGLLNGRTSRLIAS
jgi:GNAT acetyltransferase-like protein